MLNIEMNLPKGTVSELLDCEIEIEKMNTC